MRLLLIEDDGELVDTLSEQFAAIRPPVLLTVAGSRDSALAALEADSFDLVICDLKIPTVDGALDHHVAHGIAVETHIASRQPGIPLLILSGFATLEMMEELMGTAKQADCLGNLEPLPMLRYLQKNKLHECINHVEFLSRQIQMLNDIVISPSARLVPDTHARILRIFARRQSGALIHLRELPGGLSGSRTYLVDVLDGANRQRAHTVAKIGQIGEILDERDRIKRVVSPMLDIGVFAHVIDTVDVGAGSLAGLFSRRAAAHEKSLFDVLAEQPDNAVEILGLLRSIEEPWINASSHEKFKIKHVREWFLKDEDVLTFLPDDVDWVNFEDRSVMCHIGIQHGDLHCGNVLVDPDGKPLLIDFARSTDDVSLTIDPFSLEFSMFFHPMGREILGDWSGFEALDHWMQSEKVWEDHPFRGFALACRQWADGIASNYRELLAVAYGYAARQLKYDDTDPKLAIAVIRASIAAFD